MCTHEIIMQGHHNIFVLTFSLCWVFWKEASAFKKRKLPAYFFLFFKSKIIYFTKFVEWLLRLTFLGLLCVLVLSVMLLALFWILQILILKMWFISHASPLIGWLCNHFCWCCRFNWLSWIFFYDEFVYMDMEAHLHY